MKKSILLVAGVVMTILCSLSVISPVKAQAADKASAYVKDAEFIDAYQGTANDDSKIFIALYEKKDNELIFYQDGFSKGFSTYTIKDATAKNIGKVKVISIDEGIKLSLYDKEGENPQIFIEDTAYNCKHLTQSEALKLISEE
ncbi:hypothetical protein [Butyrivibrio sp. VCB2006]|uniref:hypothetical protein n=1 Tax=Butyrivibrio sp. VCB2006 TaxID=1280679 RepID=UPI0004212654|nr:hypothetical protein [Butyrivibrio sp. VCB2006]